MLLLLSLVICLVRFQFGWIPFGLITVLLAYLNGVLACCCKGLVMAHATVTVFETL